MRYELIQHCMVTSSLAGEKPTSEPNQGSRVVNRFPYISYTNVRGWGLLISPYFRNDHPNLYVQICIICTLFCIYFYAPVFPYTLSKWMGCLHRDEHAYPYRSGSPPLSTPGSYRNPRFIALPMHSVNFCTVPWMMDKKLQSDLASVWLHLTDLSPTVLMRSSCMDPMALRPHRGEQSARAEHDSTNYLNPLT